jgi:HK97 family phage major capsid protein
MEQTIEKTEIGLPADLAKRYQEAKNDAERNAVLFEFARSRGAEETTQKEAAAMSDEQFRTFLQKVGEVSAQEAKAAIAAVAGEVERKYNLDGDEAKNLAERSFQSAEQDHLNRREDFAIAAEVFRGMFLARQGKPDAYRAAIEKEAEYFQRKYGRKTRAMSLGTDSTGGYLAPQKFSDLLYENIARQSHVRKYATMIAMNANEVINIPTLTASLSAAVVAEAGTASGVQPTFSQKQLTTKKIVTKTRPVSVEMLEKANPAIVQLLLNFATIEIMKAEDSLVFGTTGNGIRASSTNNVVQGSAAGGYASLDFDDLIDLESELTAEYLAGDDIQGSGLIGDAPRYWLPHSLVQQLKKKKETGTGAYLDEAKELRNQKQIFGYEAKRVLSLPDGISPVLATDDKVAIFGNLKHVWCGTEPGFRIAIADQGATDNGGSEVNLFDTAQVAIRVLEFFDSVVVDSEAFSMTKLAA